jgi:hypothetical protein
MTTNPASTGEQDVAAELYPNIAAIASAYGDPAGKYGKFLNSTGFPYADDATFFWDQPLAGGDAAVSSQNSSSNSGGGVPGHGGAVPSGMELSTQLFLTSVCMMMIICLQVL